jgi:putative ABC transport system ATP-binding protein
MLSVRHLCKRFGSGAESRLLFSELDLAVAAGEFVALTGESGSGKSTLLNIIAGLDRADSGSVEIDGTELESMSDHEQSLFRRHHLGFVFQAFHLLPYLSLADNVGLPLVLAGRGARERSAHVAQALHDVGLGDRTSAQPSELSGGEMQRVAIARALIHRPKLILADEPTGNLDETNARQVLQLLRTRVEQARAACLLVTHSPIAARVASRVYALEGGRLRET